MFVQVYLFSEVTHPPSVACIARDLRSSCGRLQSSISSIPGASQYSSISRSSRTGRAWLTCIWWKVLWLPPLLTWCSMEVKQAALILTCWLWSCSKHRPVLISLKQEDSTRSIRAHHSVPLYWQHYLTSIPPAHDGLVFPPVHQWNSSHTQRLSTHHPEHFRGVWTPVALQDATPAL